MDSFAVRSFKRSDRDQLTALVNAHVQAVLPGLSVSTNTVLSQLEREPDEFIVDPWVAERMTLVADQRGRISAAAHLLRYREDADVGESYWGVGEIRWLLCWPDDPNWPDASEAGNAITAAALAWLARSGARKVFADGALPAPGVYGLPEQWPHVRAVLERAGFVPGERTEIVFLADAAAIPRPPAPLPGLCVARTLGANGTRFTARVDGVEVGHIEVDTRIGEAGRVARQHGLADVGNLYVAETHRRRGIAGWLLGQAANWLQLGHIDRLLDYATPDQHDYLTFLHHSGFIEFTRTSRGWVLQPTGDD